MSTYTQYISDEQETEFLQRQLEWWNKKKSLKKRNDELEDKKIKIQEEIKLIEAEQQSIQEETERIEKEIQKNQAKRDDINRNEKKRQAKALMPTVSDDDDIFTVVSGERKLKKDRTPQGMDNKVVKQNKKYTSISSNERKLIISKIDNNELDSPVKSGQEKKWWKKKHYPGKPIPTLIWSIFQGTKDEYYNQYLTYGYISREDFSDYFRELIRQKKIV